MEADLSKKETPSHEPASVEHGTAAKIAMEVVIDSNQLAEPEIDIKICAHDKLFEATVRALRETYGPVELVNKLPEGAVTSSYHIRMNQVDMVLKLHGTQHIPSALGHDPEDAYPGGFITLDRDLLKSGFGFAPAYYGEIVSDEGYLLGVLKQFVGGISLQEALQLHFNLVDEKSVDASTLRGQSPKEFVLTPEEARTEVERILLTADQAGLEMWDANLIDNFRVIVEPGSGKHVLVLTDTNAFISKGSNTFDVKANLSAFDDYVATLNGRADPAEHKISAA